MWACGFASKAVLLSVDFFSMLCTPPPSPHPNIVTLIPKCLHCNKHPFCVEKQRVLDGGGAKCGGGAMVEDVN